jgi:hypothetical protein
MVPYMLLQQVTSYKSYAPKAFSSVRTLEKGRGQVRAAAIRHAVSTFQTQHSISRCMHVFQCRGFSYKMTIPYKIQDSAGAVSLSEATVNIGEYLQLILAQKC